MSPDDCEGLPFLPGNSTLIERIARDYHADFHDPLVAILRQQELGEQSWFDLLTAGLKILRQVGAEIASAKTPGEAASATLRYDKVSASMDRLEQRMLQQAVRRLSAGTLYGYGRRTVGGKLEHIPCAHWEAGDVDWENHRLVVGNERWHGVKVLDPADLSPKAAAAVADDFGIKGPPVSDADLRAFLADYVDKRQAGDPGLAETAMWEAAKTRFPHHAVARQRVRAWMRDEMDPAKRLGEGRPALH